MASKYTYEPLQGQDLVRLLVLQPGEGDVHVTFQAETLATSPRYEAISLDLGDLADTRTIYCHGSPLKIPNTLFAALKRLRPRDEERLLWADAVCINQDDALEKNQQMKLKSTIFVKASRILIWLGEDASDVDGLQELVPQALSELPKFNFDGPDLDARVIQKTREDFIERVKALQGKEEPNFLDYKWESVANLFERPWFRRRWSIQEIWIPDDKTPKLILYGDVQLNWKDLQEMIDRLQSCGVMPLIPALNSSDLSKPTKDPLMQAGSQPTRGITSFFSMHQIKHTRKNSDLLDHLMMAATLTTADPRDRIYALLGLGEVDFGVEPRYDLNVEEAYKFFSKTVLVENQNLRALAFAPNTMAETLGKPLARLAIPSWVPDFSIDGPLNHLSKSVLRPQLFNAGGEETPKIRVSEDGNLLYLKGFIVDKVQTVGKALPEIPITTPSPPPPPPQSKHWFDEKQEARLADWVKECSHIASNGDWASLSEAERLGFAKTMMADLMGMRSLIPKDSLDDAVTYFDYLLALYDGREPGEKLGFGKLFLPQMAMMSCATNRRFCATENHRFGQIRHEGKAGDVFAIFLGAEVPYLLRPTDHGTYTLIGDCFLLDMMNGEVLEEGRYETVEIVLE